VVRRHFQYLKYRTGVIRSVHHFSETTAPGRFTILIPDSVGDIAVNSGVTRAIRAATPLAHITLITDRKYTAASAFNRDYDAVKILGTCTDKPPWALSYRDQLRAARALTPDMDVLYLCQPGVWCDELFGRYHILDLQHHLCGTPPQRRFRPRLTLPAGAADRARAIRLQRGQDAAFIAPGSFTLKFGAAGMRFFGDLAASMAESGWRVFWNGPDGPAWHDEAIIGVADLPLPDVVALAGLCQRAVSARSGLSDLMAFACPELPQYVLYPRTRYPHSRRSVLACYSLTAMGAENVRESENSLATDAELRTELGRVRRWLTA
jgi:hypothetical protein